MGWFDFLRKDGRFVSEKAYEENLARQGVMNQQTLSQLGNYGVGEDSELSLEFFFYSDKQQKAEALAEQLRDLGYRLEKVDRAAGNNRLWVVSGWTTKMRMNLPTVTGWTKRMCALGNESDCDFDGWGTSPG